MSPSRTLTPLRNLRVCDLVNEKESCAFLPTVVAATAGYVPHIDSSCKVENCRNVVQIRLVPKDLLH